MTTPLEEELKRLIAAEGPIPVARYMALCLGHPRHGYYRTRDPLGAAGDFTTAPEISQMFGELLGLWAVAVWQAMGEPEHVFLVELGPGRGTLMADALRAARLAPEFREAAAVHLVETSPALRERQREALPGVGVTWHDDVAELPDGPLIVIANEFFDALPVSQAVRAADGWHERVVGLDAGGDLAFGLAPYPIAQFETLLPEAPPGAVFEWRADPVLPELCRRIAGFGGAALALDYGHAASGLGDTLQAVRGHRFVSPLETPGEADLTAHVDFAAMKVLAERTGLGVLGPVTQGEFLRRLGIEARAARLKERATPAQAAQIDAALKRLAGDAPEDMGQLFKALAIVSPGLSVPGFFA